MMTLSRRFQIILGRIVMMFMAQVAAILNQYQQRDHFLETMKFLCTKTRD